MKIVARLLWITTLALGLSACATHTTSTRYPPPVVDRSPPPATTFPSGEPAPITPPPRSTSSSALPASGPAVIALLERADRQYMDQDLDSAAATLERALRIEPRNPLLWHRLASVRLDQGQIDQAMQMAAKSNSLAGSNHSLLARNWQLISLAYRAKGDLDAARSAEDKARQFE
ncbi:MAG: tetratricopeptide repeat protein [Gammaproteobacteria bacterium]|nr:tetratricopeptide repeat protein [Gammaproteobacteria bacterium]